MVIVIGGMIGTGKTTLANILGAELGGKVFYEEVDKSRILPLFYTASDEEIQRERYPFLLQLEFLNSRFKLIKEAYKNRNNVLDRSIYEDLYFCKCNYELGRINKNEFEIYQDLLLNMLEELEGLPQKAPDLMIYLNGSFETVINRILTRGREFEVSSDLIEYYKYLWSNYNNWIDRHYNYSDIIKINIDEVDLLNDAKAREDLIHKIILKRCFNNGIVC